MIRVIDYGRGNVHSVLKAFAHEGAEVQLSSNPDEIAHARKLVLPGVGAFGDGMKALHERGLVEAIVAAAKAGTPILGICLGMQLLLSESEEFGRHPGLGLIEGTVALIHPGGNEKVPHIGWNRLTPPPTRIWGGTVLSETTPGTAVYFVHSYAALPVNPQHRLADVTYGQSLITAAVKKGHVTGCQFHPEKSGPAGLSMIRQFAKTPSAATMGLG